MLSKVLEYVFPIGAAVAGGGLKVIKSLTIVSINWAETCEKLLVAGIAAIICGLLGFFAKKIGDVLWYRLTKKYPCLRTKK